MREYIHTPVSGITIQFVTVAQPNHATCIPPFVHATVESGDPGTSGGAPITEVCVEQTPH